LCDEKTMEAKEFALELIRAIERLKSDGIEEIRSENLIKYLADAAKDFESLAASPSAADLELYKAKLQKWVEQHRNAHAHSVEMFRSVITAGQNARAAQAFEKAAERLEAVERVQPAADIDTLRHIRAEWWRKAGYHYKGLGTQEDKARGLDAFVSAATTELSGRTPDLEEVIGDHHEAIKLAEELRRYKELDHLTHGLYILQRKKASGKGRWVFVIASYVNDWLWGYGTKPLRLCGTVMVTTFLFALLYLLFQETQLRTNPIDPVSAPSWYLLLCIGYSLYSLLPTGMIEWLTGMGLVVWFGVTGVTKMLSAVEAVIGLIYLGMATVVIKHVLRRHAVAKSE
jgi:hypothetical protein